MTTILGQERDLEFEAEIRELAKTFLPDLPPPPPLKPNLTAISEAEPSLDLLRERFWRARDELREAERKEAEKQDAAPDTSEAEKEAKKWREAFKDDPLKAAALMQGRQIRNWQTRAGRGEE